MTLTPEQRQQLAARAHSLRPVVLIGSNGLTPAVLKEIGVALDAHELVKVRVASASQEERTGMLADICAALGADPIRHIGRILVLFREKPPQAPAPTRKPARRRVPRPLKRSFQNTP